MMQAPENHSYERRQSSEVADYKFSLVDDLNLEPGASAGAIRTAVKDKLAESHKTIPSFSIRIDKDLGMVQVDTKIRLAGRVLKYW